MKNMIDALVRRQNELKKDDRGFSLIELLVVVLIIGVLAAIAIPVYMNTVATAEENALKGAAATAKATFAQYVFEVEGGTPPTGVTDIASAADVAAADSSTTDIIVTAGGSGDDASAYTFCASDGTTHLDAEGTACTP